MNSFITLAVGSRRDNQEPAAKEPMASSSGSKGIFERISHIVGGGEQKPAEERRLIGLTGEKSTA